MHQVERLQRVHQSSLYSISSSGTSTSSFTSPIAILYATIMTQEGIPVCLYAAKRLSTTDESCAEGDQGMREELERVKQRTTLPEVYTVSAVECSLRFDKVDKASGLVLTFVKPDVPDADPCEGTGKVTREQWQTDLLSPEGYRRVMAVVTRVTVVM